jgi:hypothetical protein
MLESERIAWLATLKPGDQVAILQKNLGGMPTYLYYTIKHITEKRNRFDLERDGRVLSVDKTGETPRSNGRYYISPDRIEPITDQVRYSNKIAVLHHKLEKKLGLTEALRLVLSADKYERIINIIDEPVPNADINLPQS